MDIQDYIDQGKVVVSSDIENGKIFDQLIERLISWRSEEYAWIDIDYDTIETDYPDELDREKWIRLPAGNYRVSSTHGFDSYHVGSEFWDSSFINLQKVKVGDDDGGVYEYYIYQGSKGYRGVLNDSKTGFENWVEIPRKDSSGNSIIGIVASDTQPSSDIAVNTLWIDTSGAWPILKWYDSTASQYKNVYVVNAMTTDVYDTHGLQQDPFEAVVQSLSSVRDQLSDYTKHKTNQLSLKHLTADQHDYFVNSMLTKDDIDLLFDPTGDTYKELQEYASTQIQTKLHGDSSIQNVNTLKSTYEDHILSHITEEDVTNWNSKAPAEHTHAANTIKIYAHNIILTSTETSIPLDKFSEGVERVYDLSTNPTLLEGSFYYSTDAYENQKFYRAVKDSTYGTITNELISDVVNSPDWDRWRTQIQAGTLDITDLGLQELLSIEALSKRIHFLNIPQSTISAARSQIQVTLGEGGGTDTYPMKDAHTQIEVSFAFTLNNGTSKYCRLDIDPESTSDPAYNESKNLQITFSLWNDDASNIASSTDYNIDDHNPLWASNGIGFITSEKSFTRTYTVNGKKYDLLFGIDDNGPYFDLRLDLAYNAARSVYDATESDYKYIRDKLINVATHISDGTGVNVVINEPIQVIIANFNTVEPSAPDYTYDGQLPMKIRSISYAANPSQYFPNGFFVAVINDYDTMISKDGINWDAIEDYHWNNVYDGDGTNATSIAFGDMASLFIDDCGEVFDNSLMFIVGANDGTGYLHRGETEVEQSFWLMDGLSELNGESFGSVDPKLWRFFPAWIDATQLNSATGETTNIKIPAIEGFHITSKVGMIFAVNNPDNPVLVYDHNITSTSSSDKLYYSWRGATFVRKNNAISSFLPSNTNLAYVYETALLSDNLDYSSDTPEVSYMGGGEPVIALLASQVHSTNFQIQMRYGSTVLSAGSTGYHTVTNCGLTSYAPRAISYLPVSIHPTGETRNMIFVTMDTGSDMLLYSLTASSTDIIWKNPFQQDDEYNSETRPYDANIAVVGHARNKNTIFFFTYNKSTGKSECWFYNPTGKVRTYDPETDTITNREKEYIQKVRTPDLGFNENTKIRWATKGNKTYVSWDSKDYLILDSTQMMENIV